ncbi:hypothetical protein DOY81_005600 [Sarcophaga bullata]|nr:hypothetical protein DOY81_005600 [Sarcophaga bullata]
MSLAITSASANCHIDNCVLLPKYSDFCKFLLVEELCLEEDYRRLHYGKCTIIGKIRNWSNSSFQLENVRVKNLSNEYTLPEGTLSIRLLTFSYFGTKLTDSKYVEICGEVVLYNTKEPEANHQTLLTSRGIAEQVALTKTTDNKANLKLLKHYQEHYKPAIKLWFVQQINRAEDLIQRNLELRMLQESMS